MFLNLKKKYINLALKSPNEEIEDFLNEILAINKIAKDIYEQLYPVRFFGNFKI